MPMNVYFTRPLLRKVPKEISQEEGKTLIGSLHVLPAGPYLLFAKMVLVTSYGDDNRDSARAELALEAGGLVDTGMSAMWHIEGAAFQPVDMICLQLAATVNASTPGDAAVKVFCTSYFDHTEVKDLVITAISVDTIEDQDSPLKPIFNPTKPSLSSKP